MLGQYAEELSVATRGRALYEITREVAALVTASGFTTGLATLHVRHTSASLLIQENADPTAAADLLAWLERLAPDGDPHYSHTAEGPDDMPSHLRSAITRTSEAIPVNEGQLALGTYQGIYLLEHGADPNADGAGYTALHAAVLRSQVHLASALLDHGADPGRGRYYGVRDALALARDKGLTELAALIESRLGRAT